MTLIAEFDRANPSSNPEPSATVRYDVELQRRVQTFLASRHRPALRRVEVEAREGIVTLRGRVQTFHEKQLSVQLARRVAGVIRLVDEVTVQGGGAPGVSAHPWDRRFSAQRRERVRGQVSSAKSA